MGRRCVKGLMHDQLGIRLVKVGQCGTIGGDCVTAEAPKVFRRHHFQRGGHRSLTESLPASRGHQMGASGDVAGPPARESGRAST
jgi:hypothetical protein